ncbi:MAG: hypothetical protein A2186_02695 [Candidatus Levybacteria bacterium RIFOXYA1_FULL_41_10]|nr:MAG: hypothetical protein UT44_C0038G0005 [Candidatus Levybacteria bacterium GW2011_GWA1_39_32]KKR51312.1 MAG: hypothetical protein UT87_C0007G0072 [Candidatus Levybacteria bacterium GW2011_GWC1_40_19]KKR94603.1 MAG: hypothetical protein UU45_C0008G0003 [Candidatus Levybacteria bacterium GW2011_GWA2_41_15]KKS00912.1 MAG: hypothetical protein UU52_C0023G0007 [Candidatus Levybacteria bacterium GW2011_GWB1_41_21]OGH27025.1 MAG: hypothetical protein A3D82_02920 [Candidatus Levybacteria bacterium
MKKIIFLLSIIFLLGFLAKEELISTAKAAPEYIKTHAPPKWPVSDPLCLKFTVKFNADSQWKKNQSSDRFIMAGCDGEGSWKPKRPACTGGLVKIHPGETATLGRCSCFNIGKVTDQEGCLKLGKKLTIEDQKKGYKKRRNVTVVEPLSDTQECKIKVTNRKGKVLEPDDKFQYICGINEQKKKVNVNIKCEKQKCPKPAQVTNVKVTCPECDEVEQE